KQELSKVLKANSEIAIQYPELNDLVVYYQETIQHAGHYLYVVGPVIINWSQMLSFRNQLHNKIKSKIYLILWILSDFLYSLLLTAVSIKFLKGTIVGRINLSGAYECNIINLFI
ncbi:8150_t:CDS:2, partial [Entrophospora sp. SA101]